MALGSSINRSKHPTPPRPLTTPRKATGPWPSTHWVPKEKAKTFRGVFANQNIVCKLRHPETVAFLKKGFVRDGE